MRALCRGGQLQSLRYRHLPKEYAIIEAPSREFAAKELCALCGVSRPGLRKWRARAGKAPADRAKALRLVRQRRDAHPSHGYRWARACLKKNEGITASAEYIRCCFLFLGTSARTKRRAKGSQGKVRDPCPNPIFSTWETAGRPRQVGVSDMAALWTRTRYWELVLCFDTFAAGELGRKGAFAHRVLDPTPRFMREKLARAEEAAAEGGVGASDPLLR